MIHRSLGLTGLALTGLAALSACGSSPIGEPPPFTPPAPSLETAAMVNPSLPPAVLPPEMTRASSPASLWTGDRGSLLGDDRAMARGDILTVVIEIDDSAQIENSSDRSRSGSQEASVEALFGLRDRPPGKLVSFSSEQPGKRRSRGA